MTTMWLRRTLVALAVPLLLSACGGVEKKVRQQEPGPPCKTEGTVESQPAGSIDAAVAPYREPCHRVRITERHSDTATVLLEAKESGPEGVAVTLVRTEEGWAVTSVQRC